MCAARFVERCFWLRACTRRVFFFAAGAGRVFFFAAGARRVFFFAAGARRVFFFLLRVRGAFCFFCCGCAVCFFCCGCVARFFLLRVRGVFFFAARVCGVVFRAMFFDAGMHAACGLFFFAAGAGRVLFFAAGARHVCVFAAGARRAFLCAAGSRRVFFAAAGARRVFLLRVRSAFFFVLQVRGVFFFAAGVWRGLFSTADAGGGPLHGGWMRKPGGAFFHLGAGGMMGLRRRVYVLAAGARRVCLFFAAAARISCSEQRWRTVIQYMVALKWAGHGWAWQYQCQTMKRLKTAAWLGWGRTGLAWPKKGWETREIQPGGPGR